MGESPKAILPGRAPILRVRGAAWAGGSVRARDAVPLVLESVTTCADCSCAGCDAREWRAGRKDEREGQLGAASAGGDSRSWREEEGTERDLPYMSRAYTKTAPSLRSCLTS
jgi:hypothetical protein